MKTATSTTSAWWPLLALGFATLCVGVDVTVLNLALPTLARDLKASTSDLQWFVDSYSLVLAALILPAGALGDRFGRKALLVAALAIFGVASLACGLSTSTTGLIAARAALGAGSAFILPMSVAVLPVLFPKDEDRNKAMGVWTAFNAFSFPIGPIIGGFILEHFSWSAVFFLNVPIVVIGLVAVLFLLPESKAQQAPRIDVPGIVLSSLALVAFTYGMIELGDHDITDVDVAGPIAVAIAAGCAFVFVERKKKDHALVELDLFAHASFSWGTALATLVSFAMFGVLFCVPQFFQSVRGDTAMSAGLRLLPLIGGLFVGAAVGGRIAKRLGNRVVVATGLAVLAAGLALGATTHVDDAFSSILLFITIVGVGLGLSLPTAMSAALGELSSERSGAGSALIMALRQVGGTIGVALLGTLLSSQYRAHLERQLLDKLPPDLAAVAQRGVTGAIAIADKLHLDALATSAKAAFASGMDALFIACACCAGAAAILAAAFLPRSKESAKAAPVSVAP